MPKSISYSDISDYLKPHLMDGVEGCAFILADEEGNPYILQKPNQATSVGLATSNRFLFAMETAQMWRLVWKGGHTLLAVLHNHPLGSFVTPSHTDITQGSVVSFYIKEGQVRVVPWLIYNGFQLKAWDINPNQKLYRDDPSLEVDNPHELALASLGWYAGGES